MILPVQIVLIEKFTNPSAKGIKKRSPVFSLTLSYNNTAL